MTLLMSNALILLLLVCLGESVAHQQLLRKPRAPLPLRETHGVTREVLEEGNHEVHYRASYRLELLGKPTTNICRMMYMSYGTAFALRTFRCI